MSKNNSNLQKIPELAQANYKIFHFPNHWFAYVLLALISFGVYFNSIWNENALDDGIIIQKNEFVLRGMKGIKGIMTKDSYYSFYRQMRAEDQLAGGRYRPLSVVTFALEQQFIGTYPSGFFTRFTDTSSNRMGNGIIEPGEVNWWIDQNKDAAIQDFECVECWDKNQNFKRDTVKVQDKSGKWVAAYVDVQLPGGGIKDPKTGKMRDATIKVPVFEEDVNKDGNVNDKDCEVEGAKIRHTNNVILFSVLVLLIFALLKDHMFKGNHDLAFIAALLFAIHPIHTEVVSNVKSRDEIMSMIFICLTFIYAFKTADRVKADKIFVIVIALISLLLGMFYHVAMFFLLAPAGIIAVVLAFSRKSTGQNAANLILTGLLFWLSLLSKEYAISMIAMVPMTLWLFRKNADSKQMIRITGVMIGFFVLYLFMRFSSVTIKPGVPNTEVLNDPYLFATKSQKWATKIYVLIKYLQLSFFPHPLSSDYSFNTIPYKRPGDIGVILSLLTHLGLVAAGVWLFIKRKPAAFAFLFYFGNLFWICNLFFDIGATMGERLIFHSSLGVTIGVAWLLTEGLARFMSYTVPQKAIVALLTLLIVGAGGYKTWQRNYDWKNDITLFCNDVNTVPNSVLVLGNAGARWIDKSEWPEHAFVKDSMLRRAAGYLRHALDLHPKYVNGYLNLGLAYYKLDELDSAAITWKRAEELYPTNPYLSIYYNVIVPRLMAEGFQKGQAKDFTTAVRYLNKAVWLRPADPETNYNLGGAYFSIGQLDSAEVYFRKTLQYKPDHKQALEGMNTISIQRNNMGAAMIKP